MSRNRHEFNRRTREDALARAKGECENRACRAPLTIGKYHYDHILPDALGGKPTLANCQVLCSACHKAKTAKEDIPRIRKADRQRAIHIGAKVRSGPQIKSRGFPTYTREKPAARKPSLPPKSIYR